MSNNDIHLFYGQNQWRTTHLYWILKFSNYFSALNFLRTDFSDCIDPRRSTSGLKIDNNEGGRR